LVQTRSITTANPIYSQAKNHNIFTNQNIFKIILLEAQSKDLLKNKGFSEIYMKLIFINVFNKIKIENMNRRSYILIDRQIMLEKIGNISMIDIYLNM